MKPGSGAVRDDWWKRNELRLGLLILGTMFFLVYFADNIFISISPGKVGVLWERFGGGTITRWTYGEGLHVIFPWDRMYLYDIRLQSRDLQLEVLSSDGLRIGADFVIRFKPVEQNLGFLHKYAGPRYVVTIVEPEVGEDAREIIGQYNPDQLYASNRVEIERRILRRVREHIRVKYRFDSGERDLIFVEDVLLRRIRLPAIVAAAIDHKLAQKHMMLEYDYRIEKEQKEARRKQIEATGIKAFQDIVTNGISDRYLKWKGIDATLELARSNNSKVVVIGAGQYGLPIILGNDAFVPQPAPRTGSAPPP